MSTPRLPQLHRLKIWDNHLAEVRERGRRFEIRKDDRDFQVGDVVIFDEWDPIGAKARGYTGAFFGPVQITHVTRSECIPEGWCGFSFVSLVRIDQKPSDAWRRLEAIAEGRS